MRSFWVVMLFAVACSKAADGPKELVALEQRIGRKADGVVLAPSGIYVDRVHVEAGVLPDALAKSKAAKLEVWLADDESPATQTLATLRRIAAAAKRPVDLLWPLDAGVRVLCDDAELAAIPLAGPDIVVLSVLFQAERVWVGLSRVNEFQEIPKLPASHDYEKLEMTLKEHKQSALLEQRVDLEIGAETGVASKSIAIAFDIACKVGFRKIVLPERVTAQPAL